jgi:hypothetical protein
MLLINKIIKNRLSENKSYKVRYNPDKTAYPARMFKGLKLHMYYCLHHKSLYFLDHSIKANYKIILTNIN